ncbi:hypothetical protein [Pseudoclavibacter helvolus]|uniref:hypothetical protein n=1 Tax=Pseudoclavibacter helvolus TaxID=255205 RepID=UPI003C76384C
MIVAADAANIDPGFITLGVAVIGVLGVLATVWATRGKTKTDAKTALDARIDARVKEQLEGAWSEIDQLKKHSAEQDKAIKGLEERDKQKSAVFQRIFATLAAMLRTTPELDLTTSEIALVGDTIPPGWIKHMKENP